MATVETAEQRAERRRERNRGQRRDDTAKRSEVGPCQPPNDQALYDACERNLLLFLETHFPETTGSTPFGEDHKRFIGRIERCILGGGRFVNAIFRGAAKTTIAQCAVIWSVLYGHRTYPVLLAAGQDAADENMHAIKTELEENDILFAQFERVCKPVRHLEGKPQGAKSQTQGGERTHIVWRATRIVLPRVAGSVSSGATIYSRGLHTAIRGLNFKAADGRSLRPDFFIVDDPQTDESAVQPAQVDKRINLLKRAVLKMAGHRKNAACVVNGTPIVPNDMIEVLLDPIKTPSFQGERIPMVHKWADAHETFWLGPYAEARNTFDRGDIDGQIEAQRRATELYRQHRDMADAGCRVAWESAFDPVHELSAIQHAYNMLIDDGELVFDAECQCRPRATLQENPLLSPADLLKRMVAIERGQASDAAQWAVSLVDVSDEFLFYATLSVDAQFNGVVEWGTWPDFEKRYFTKWQANGWGLASKLFFEKYPQHRARAEKTESGRLRAPFEAKIYFMLSELVPQLLNRRLTRAGSPSAPLAMNKIGIDCRWGKASDVCKRFIHDMGRNELVPYMGQAVPPTKKQYEDYTRTPGWLFEDQIHPELREVKWIYRPGPDGRYYLSADVNRLKTFLMQRLSCPMGSPGSIALHKARQGFHDIFADQVAASEYPMDVIAAGYKKEMWQPRDGNPDNEGLDCLAGCVALASWCGAKLNSASDGAEYRPRRRGKRSLKSQWQEKKARDGG